ncbi:MAG: 30S ribosomal protein S21 [Nitrospirae bacterium RBG_19FT_COMBO_55_12]|nr:MAG: 30S ribosomal protein S21 [Nitrospirae bacterium RBG_19FT_COMBO_55_12]
MEIRVQSRDIEKALRTLKKKLQLDGLFGELKKRRHYEKPSVKKKNKQLEAEKRRRKLLKRARTGGSSWPRAGRPSQSPAASNSQVRT